MILKSLTSYNHSIGIAVAWMLQPIYDNQELSDWVLRPHYRRELMPSILQTRLRIPSWGDSQGLGENLLLLLCKNGYSIKLLSSASQCTYISVALSLHQRSFIWLWVLVSTDSQLAEFREYGIVG